MMSFDYVESFRTTIAIFFCFELIVIDVNDLYVNFPIDLNGEIG